MTVVVDRYTSINVQMFIGFPETSFLCSKPLSYFVLAVVNIKVKSHLAQNTTHCKLNGILRSHN